MKKPLYFPVLVLSAGLIGGAVSAQESVGISLPANGQMGVWDMRADPPAAIVENLPTTVVPGQCYQFSDNKLTPQQGNSCLDYYTASTPSEGAEQISATGQLAFNDVPPDYAFRGLELRGVEGIVDCGERDSCDVLYIAGFANSELTAEAMSAAREGRTVTLTGRKAWNAESIDIIVDGIEAAH